MADGYLGDQQPPPRSRRPSLQASSQRSPEFDWGSAPTEDDKEGPQDLRSSPLPMSLKRALWYETSRGGTFKTLRML